MKISNSAKYVIGVSAAVALLAGCTGNGGSQLTPGSSMGSNHQVMGSNHKVSLYDTLITPRSVRPNLHVHMKNESAPKPNCCALQKTVFISDAFGGSSFTGAIYMFDYVTGASLGSVAKPPEGFLEVQGGCADTSGNVYFTNTSLSDIDEYNHSGTYVSTISDPGQYPVGCSFDKKTGNLAITNIISTSGGAGSLSIASGGVITNTYPISNMSRVYFLDYDNTGTLWVDGSNSSGIFELDTFNGSTFTPVTVSGATILFPGAVKWTANKAAPSINVGDQDTFSSPTFYQVSSTGTVTGSTVTTCTQSSNLCDIVQATIKGPGLVGPDAILLSANRFAYPAGGAPTLNYPATYSQPIGSAVSPNKT